jgi:hypothetical protein
MSADPYRASAGASEPGSWNRYAYVAGDPVNFSDPDGLAQCWVSGDVTDGEGDNRRKVTCHGLGGIGSISIVYRNSGLSDADLVKTAKGENAVKAMDDLAFRYYLNGAMHQALQALKKTSCRDLFGTGADPAAVLTAMANGTSDIGAIDHEEDVGTASIHPPEVGSDRINIFLNDNGPFFAGYTQYEDILFLRQTHTPEEVNDIYNGVTLLHELGHIFAHPFLQDRLGGSQIVGDAGNPTQSQANRLKVALNCFGRNAQ